MAGELGGYQRLVLGVNTGGCGPPSSSLTLSLCLEAHAFITRKLHSLEFIVPNTSCPSSLCRSAAQPALPNAEPKRRLGAQLPAVAEAFRRLKAKGIGGAFVWALDNSCACGYKTEAALLAIAAEAPGLQGGAASHEHSSQHCCCVIA